MTSDDTKQTDNVELKHDETLERDKLLLDLMIHAYDEDERRNELVDNKNCQMKFRKIVL